MRLLRAASACALVLILAAGCGGGSDEEAAKTPPKRRSPAHTKQPVADEAERVEYRYDPTGKPDPFRSFVLALQSGTGAGSGSPLERFDLSQLRLRGVIWGNDRPRALVMDPAGKAYIVAQGTPIGKNEGRIVRIADDGVTVKETYVDFLGKATTKDIELRLQERQGG